MSYNPSQDFLIDVAKGNIAGHSIVHKFGRIAALTTTITPICGAGVFPTPTPSNAVTLEAVSSSASDTAAGVGAREITIEYLDNTGAQQSGSMTMAGTSASTTVAGVWRIQRAYVSSAGVYASQTSASHVGTITIRVAGGGATWASLPLVDTAFGIGQSLIGSYTVPLGKTAYMLSQTVSVDSTKAATMVFFKREGALDETVPYSSLRAQNIYTGLSGVSHLPHQTHEVYPELTDMGFMGYMSTGTGDVSAEFEILLVDN